MGEGEGEGGREIDRERGREREDDETSVLNTVTADILISLFNLDQLGM